MTFLDIILIIVAVAAVGVGGFFYIKKKGIGALVDVPALLEKAVDELEGHLKELNGSTIWERKILLVLDRVSDKSPVLDKAITQLRDGKARYAIANFRKAIDEMRAKAGK
jgi:uncharacterized protein YneF (UPF0154 family)